MTYAGIYRYSNNPDTITSYAAMYGLAILSRSKTLGSIALASQLAQFAFLRFVEMPHTNMLYGEHKRDDGALWATIKQKVCVCVCVCVCLCVCREVAVWLFIS
jgi:phosphatidylethanolamine N-methyltransferase